MREIVLDTETTGLDPATGHRIVEIACLELRNHVATGEHRRWYLNPEMAMPPDAQAVHGLTDAFLSGQPVFAEVVVEFLDFIADSPLVIHNAAFDMKFLNAELTRHGYPALPSDRARDTLTMARQRFPGAQASLDALCRRFGIDNSERTLHGGLLDVQLLAECYLELLGGRQAGFHLEPISTGSSERLDRTAVQTTRPRRTFAPTAEEIRAHEVLVAKLKAPIWLKP